MSEVCTGSSTIGPHVYDPSMLSKRCRSCGWLPSPREDLFGSATGKALDDHALLRGTTRAPTSPSGGYRGNRPETDAELRERLKGELECVAGTLGALDSLIRCRYPRSERVNVELVKNGTVRIDVRPMPPEAELRELLRTEAPIGIEWIIGTGEGPYR